MAKFWSLVNKVIRESDILLEIIDARYPEESRNREIEEKVKDLDKRLVYVFNKVDLITKKEQDELTLFPSVHISASKHTGTMRLLRLLSKMAGDNQVKIGVLGYPNVGKSSVINALKGRKSAPTSSVSGYTKALQKIRISQKLILVDTPGVFPYDGKSDFAGFFGAIDPTKMRDVESIAMELIAQKTKIILAHYDLEENDDPDEILDAIANKVNALKKGNIPDQKRAAVRLLQDWQKGKIK